MVGQSISAASGNPLSKECFGPERNHEGKNQGLLVQQCSRKGHTQFGDVYFDPMMHAVFLSAGLVNQVSSLAYSDSSYVSPGLPRLNQSHHFRKYWLQYVGSLSASSRNLSWQCPLLAMPISHEIHTNTYCHTKLYTNRCNFLYTPILLIHHNICQYVKILIHTVTYQYRQVHFIYSPQNAWDLVHHVFDAGKSLFDLQLVSCHWSIICLGPVSPAKRKPA